MVEKFKPNLIPNNPKDRSFDISEALKKNGSVEDYKILVKKDGCRLQAGITDTVLTRSLKQPKSNLVINRFQRLNDICKELKIALDGEFYMHGLKFNSIFRFFSKFDVTDEDYKKSLEREFKKSESKFNDKYDNLSIEFLTTFHKDLKFWMFDGIVLDRPDLVGYEERIKEIISRLENFNLDEIVLPIFLSADSEEHLNNIYKNALTLGWEGLVLTHKDHEYKFGRNSLNQGTILKMKDDALEYDGVIIDIKESSKIKDGIARTTNELGRSETSKKKADRELSGMAKSFTIEYEGLGTFDVGLKGFDNNAKKELLENKEKYIGRHFTYMAMAPVKNFPRHAYFKHWRDSK